MRARALGIAAAACVAAGGFDMPAPPRARVPACTPEELVQEVRRLSDDSMRGRRAGTDDARRAARYVAARMGGTLQPVPLRGARTVDATLRLARAGAPAIELRRGAALVLWSELGDATVDRTAAVVDAGYGIVAPDAGWDDYAGRAVTGRLVVVRAGAPDSGRLRLPGGAGDARRSAEHKLAVARARGALGVLFLADSGDAEPARRRGADTVERTVAGAPRAPLALVGWLGPAASRAIESLLGASGAPVTARAVVRQRTHAVAAENVVAVRPGRGALAGEAVLLVAHLDGLGVGAPVGGDSVYNGAHDDASGVAALLCLARDTVAPGEASSRTVVYVATAAEEGGTGHAGIAAYLDAPAVPVARTAAALNVDGVSIVARTRDFMALPVSATDAAALVDSLGRAAGLRLADVGGFERAFDHSFDTAELLARGVGALTIWPGTNAIALDRQAFFQRSRAINGRYHTPHDTVSADWDVGAIADHLALLRALRDGLARSDRRVTVRADGPLAPLRLPDAR